MATFARKFGTVSELLEKLKAELSDRYDVERELGEGGMATVFLARDVKHGRRVAIKVLHEDLGAALGMERFRREIQIATNLQHPHILALYDSGEAAGSLFYVMPYIEGESLRHRIDREQMLPIDQALKLTGEVASALDYAHRKGVVHRDIKPENILIDEGHAIVADFGIARAVSTMGEAGGALTKTGMSLGTPTYMSPEQSFGEKEIDGRSDLYSLACVLYEMLTGQPPFTGSNAQAIMAKHSMAEVPSMQIVRSTIPDEVEDVVQKALAKSAADRFASVAEFAEELQESLIDYHTTTRRAVTERRTAERRTSPRVPPGRRASDVGAQPWWRKPAIMVAAPLLVIALGGAWWFFGRNSTKATAGGLDPAKVAVMYFQDPNPDAKLAYLADGLTESLISRLSEVKAIDVISADGVSQFRGKNVSVDSVATALSVGTVVRGTVEADGDKIKVKVNLINGNSGEISRSDEFEQPAANIIAAQDSLAASVAEMLRKSIGVDVAVRQGKAGTSNATAWTLVQRAQKLRKDAELQLGKGDSSSATRSYASADSLLLSAASLDPKWNKPLTTRSALALSRARGAVNATEAKPWIDRGLSDAETALSRDPRDPDGLEARGSLRYLSWAYSLADNKKERDALLSGAESDLRTAVQIDPARAAAWSALSTVYSQEDDETNAKMAAQHAFESDAYLTNTDRILWKLYATSYDLEQFKDADKYCTEGGRRFPESPLFVRCKLWLQTTNYVPANPTQAWVDYAQLQKLTPSEEWKVQGAYAKMLVAASLARANQKDSARKVLASAHPDAADDKEGELAGVEAFVRTLFNTPQDNDEAIKILQKYAAASPQHRAGLRESQLWWWRKLKEDPRFQRMVAE